MVHFICKKVQYLQIRGPMMAGKKGVPEASEGNQFLGRDLEWHLAFALLLIVTLGFFIAWSMQYINNQQFMVQLLTAIVFGVFMAFNIGGNDVANSFGTSVGAGTLTMKQALVVAAIFEVSGAVLAGGEVTETVRSGIVSLDSVSTNPLDFVYIMIASLLGAALWLLIATWRGWPVSTTHSIVGGIVGAALTVGFATNTGGWEMVQWAEIGRIAISWVISPVLGGLCSFFLYSFVKKNILVYNEKADAMMKEIKQEKKAHKKSYREAFERMSDIQKVAYTNMMARDAATFAGDDFDEDDLESEYYHELFAIERRLNKIDPHAALEKWVPILASFGAIIIASMLLFKGLKNLHLDISNVGNFLILAMIGTSVWLTAMIATRFMRKKSLEKTTFLLFSWMQVFTASAFAFSHGSNDIANAVGPFAAVLDVLRTGQVNAEAEVPIEIMVSFGVALVAGLWFIGRRVIATVGTNLTEIHPSSGFSAELSAATVVMVASLLGIPVSSTHILIGAVLGVGMVNKAANWNLMKPIALAWVITLPAAALIGAVTVSILRMIY